MSGHASDPTSRACLFGQVGVELVTVGGVDGAAVQKSRTGDLDPGRLQMLLHERDVVAAEPDQPDRIWRQTNPSLSRREVRGVFGLRSVPECAPGPLNVSNHFGGRHDGIHT